MRHSVDNIHWASAILTLVAIALAAGGWKISTPQLGEARAKREQASDCLRRGIDWILGQQGRDGGWHSTTYGQMRDGAADTALALYAVSHSPSDVRGPVGPAIERALEFVLSNLDDSGFIRSPAGVGDYPNYSTALTLVAMRQLNVTDREEQQSRMSEYLAKSQLTEGADFGGWDQTGGPPDEPPLHGAGLSATCFALEALRGSDVFDVPVRDAALAFLARCQDLDSAGAGDGGFHFAPRHNDLRNKAGESELTSLHVARSYGTCTADGVRALLACGLPAEDRRVSAGIRWLEGHPAIQVVPGLPDDGETSWARGLTFYYSATLAKVLPQLSENESRERRAHLLDFLVRSQRPDGSWCSQNTRMREDDPLIATMLAVIALSALR